MPLFKTNKIFLESQTVAEQLRSARQEKKLKLKDVAKKLNISQKYLEALEKGEYSKLPTGVYGKNFLREYALLLELDYNKLASAFEQEKNIYAPSPHKDLFSKQVVKESFFWTMPRMVRNLIILGVIAIFFIYLGIRLYNIVSPPELYIYSPANNLITKKSSVDITGKTQPEAKLDINGQAVLPDFSGNFNKTVNIKSGINIINITAYKNYSRKNIITLQILKKDE